ncbi:MAG: 4-hydroxyacetophenone monooxygenase [Frankiales bacterium]|nr:4-hydroxyacetophenone monooxygenase [Frankiales bacterium]
MDLTSQHVRVCVVGTGFSGLGMAVKLKQEGIEDFVVLERADAVGGTWRDNTYPGCACDVPSSLYSFSFATSDWKHVFSRQPEIRAYLERVATEQGLRPHLRLGTSLDSGTWDDDAMVWRLQTSAGPLTADVLVSGCGGLVEPRYPDVPGVSADGTSAFAGPTFHSARWRHDVDLTGKRIAVVGTGASAIQFVPELQKAAASVVVFQRTPPWVLPRQDRPLTDGERSLMARLPALQTLRRGLVYASRELQLLGFTKGGRLRGLAEREALKQLEQQVPDPELRAALTPDYALGCKRVLLSNDYLPALASPNVEVVTTAVAEVTATGVVDGDGRLHEVDVVVFGTGFQVMDIPVAHALTGREGVTLADTWAKEGAEAHRGTTVAGFPNLFLLLGPNTALGHSSVVLMIESQIRYVAAALRLLPRPGALEVRKAAQDTYNRALAQQLETTVWNNGGCRAWYRDANGKNFTLWPTHTYTFDRLMRRFDAASYELRSHPGASA